MRCCRCVSELIRAEIEGSFARPLEEIYASFYPDSVGAASIAQVHRATTTEGKQVAVKVLRPKICERFRARYRHL